MPNGTCSLPGCERKAHCRQMCKPHYEAEKGYDRSAATCEACGATYQKSRRARTARCPSCARRSPAKIAASQRNAAASAIDKRTIWPTCRVWFGECVHCGECFSAQRRRLTCSTFCAKERAAAMRGERDRTCRDCAAPLGWFCLNTYCDECGHARAEAAKRRAWKQKRTESHKARAIRFGVAYESIDCAMVYARDGWACGLCGDPVDPEAKWPDQMCASIDHVTPLALGGPHLLENVRLAHWLCNVLRGTSDADFRLAG